MTCSAGRCRWCSGRFRRRSRHQRRHAARNCGDIGDAPGVHARNSDSRRYGAGIRIWLSGTASARRPSTPAAIIATLNKEVNAALADPKMKVRLDDLGGVPLSMSPEEFGKFLANETEKMGKVIKAAGISVK